MVSNVKGIASGEASVDIQSIMNYLASLRGDIAALSKHVSNNAFDASSAAAE